MVEVLEKPKKDQFGMAQQTEVMIFVVVRQGSVRASPRSIQCGRLHQFEDSTFGGIIFPANRIKENYALEDFYG